MSVVKHLVARHAEDAAFYWARCQEGQFSAQQDIATLKRFSHLVEANLEGLRVAQQECQACTPSNGAGWQATFSRTQKWRTADEAFVSGVLALETALAASAPTQALLDAMAQLATNQFAETGEREVAKGLALAASWLGLPAINLLSNLWQQSADPIQRYITLAAAAKHESLSDTVLTAWLQDTHPLVRAHAMRCVGELGRTKLGETLLPAMDPLQEADANCRYWAAISRCLLGYVDGAPLLGKWASEHPEQPRSRHALAVLAQLLPPDTMFRTLSNALGLPTHQRCALDAIRYTGDLRWVPYLLDLVDAHTQPDALRSALLEPASNLARLAADVLAHLTGHPIGGNMQHTALWQDTPSAEDLWEPDEAGNYPDPGSDPAIPVHRKQDPDSGLLWPDPLKLRPAMSTYVSHATFGAEQLPILGGQTLTSERAQIVLADPEATQLQRRHAALFLRCRGYSATLLSNGV